MKVIKIHIVSLLLLSNLAFPENLFAQLVPRQKPIPVYVRIGKVRTVNDSLFAIIEAGSSSGISINMRGRLLNGVDENRQDSYEVGFGVVTRVYDDSALCYIRNLYKNSTVILPGDVFVFDMNLPDRKNENILYDIALKGILFVDFYAKEVNPLLLMMKNDHPGMQDSLLNVILKDVHEVAKLVLDLKNIPPQMSRIIEQGRLKGKTAVQAMTSFTKEDVHNFLLYVKAYPLGYMGARYKVSESVAGWVFSSAPYSPAEIKYALLPHYKNPGVFTQKIKQYEWSIKLENTALQLAQEATDLALEGKNTEAGELISFARAIVYAINDTAGKVSVHLLSAQMFQDAEKYQQAINECLKAINVAKQYTNKGGMDHATIRKFEISAQIKKAYCEYKSSNFKDARASLDLVEKLLNRYRTYLGDNEYFRILGNRFNYEGTFDYLSGDYKSALVNYVKTIQVNDSINSIDAQATNAELYYFKGKIFNKQLNSKEALAALEMADRLYKSSNKEDRLANVYTEKGLAYFQIADYANSIPNYEEAYRISLKYNDNESAGYAKSTIGNAYWNMGDYKAAISAHNAAKELRSSSNSGRAYSWNQLGELYQLSGRKSEALNALDSAVKYYRRAGDSTQLAEVYSNKGMVFHKDENYRTALYYYELAKKMTETVPVYTLYNIGLTWRELDTLKARKYFIECLVLSREKGDVEYEYFCVQQLCELAYQRHDDKKGAEFFKHLQSMGAGRTDPAYIAQMHGLNAYIKLQQMDLEGALKDYYKAFAIYDTTNKVNAAWALLSIAHIYTSRGEFMEAEKILNDSRQLFVSNGDRLGEGFALFKQTLLQSFLGEYDKGIAAGDTAIAIFKNTGNNLRLANTFVSKGALYKSAGNYKAAIEIYLEADSIYKAEGTIYHRLNVLNDIGVTYFNQGDYAKAISYFNRYGDNLQPGVRDESYFLYKTNLAECYYQLKKYKDAEEILVAEFPVAESKHLSRIANSMALTLAKINFEKGLYDKSSIYLEKSKEISLQSNEKSSLAEVFVMLGKVAEKKQLVAEAEKHFRFANTIAAQYSIGTNGWLTLYESGLFFYNQKKYDTAIAHFKIAVDKFEKDARRIFGGEEASKLLNNDPRKADMYGKLIASLLKTNNQQEALVFSNKSNISGLLTLSGPLAINTGDEAKDEALRKLNELEKKKQSLEKSEKESVADAKGSNEKLVAIQAQRRIVEADYANSVDALVEKYPDLNAYFRNIDENYYNYKQELPPDVAVVMYQLNGNDLMVFTLTNDELFTYVAELDKGIYDAIRAFKAITKSSSQASGTGTINLRSEVVDEEDKVVNVSFADVSAELYDLLISPVEEKLKGKKRLCIIPNGELSNFAFQCLGTKMPDKTFDFLLSKYSIFYSNQLDVFKNTGKVKLQASDYSSFAAFGVPDKSLRFNLDEVQSIGRILGSDSTVYSDGRATELNAKKSLLNKRIIHFATHGVLSYTDFNQSYLKLLPDNDSAGGNNGKFTLSEIKTLAIRDCDLVTLSACETGVTQVKNNGWKISPANEFLKRSVRSVIASLWKVDDEATSLLMEDFYKNLKSGMDKVDALRDAQAGLSKTPRFSHPHFWGAFVLYGEWR